MTTKVKRPRVIGQVELLRDLDRPTGRVLLVEGVEQSYVDDVDDEHLEFEYMQHMALALDVVLPQRTALRCVHLGGGAMTMPRWVNATRPGSQHVVVEMSPDVVEVARAIGLPANCDVIEDDAVRALSTLATGEADVVIWDLYDGPRAVTSALTLEAITDMHRALSTTGLLLLNVSDATPFDVVRPVLAALRECFDDIGLLAEPSTLRGRRSGNCVLIGARGQTLPSAALAKAGASAWVRASLLAGADLESFIGSAVPATTASPLPMPDARKGRAFL
jgi:hypothetical protein